MAYDSESNLEQAAIQALSLCYLSAHPAINMNKVDDNAETGQVSIDDPPSLLGSIKQVSEINVNYFASVLPCAPRAVKNLISSSLLGRPISSSMRQNGVESRVLDSGLIFLVRSMTN